MERYDPARLGGGVPEKHLDSVLAPVLIPCMGPGKRVLDLGCGTFFYAPILARRFGMVAGLDFSRGMLAASKGGRGWLAVQGDAERLPFGADTFDAVVSVDFLHHVERTGPVLAEVSRVLRPGGVYAAVEPNMVNPGMLLAHLLPPEERAAVHRNWPARLRRKVEAGVGPARATFHNLSFSTQYAPVANRLFPFEKGGRPWSLRILVTSRKPRA
ncbi:MAG: class I SAM-dependent methyltransferase [Desulfatibacillaceae bacterium]